MSAPLDALAGVQRAGSAAASADQAEPPAANVIGPTQPALQPQPAPQPQPALQPQPAPQLQPAPQAQPAAAPAAPPALQVQPAPALRPYQGGGAPTDPAIAEELAKVERGTSRALLISGIVFGISSVAWGASFVNAAYNGSGDGDFWDRDPGFMWTGWTGGLALSITGATLIPIGLSREARARIVEGLPATTLQAEARALTSGIIMTSAGGLLMITSPLLFSSSSSLSNRSANTVFAALFPASIVMIGAGSGMIAASNRLRRERRRKIIYSAMPYFNKEMVGVGLSGRF